MFRSFEKYLRIISLHACNLWPNLDTLDQTRCCWLNQIQFPYEWRRRYKHSSGRPLTDSALDCTDGKDWDSSCVVLFYPETPRICKFSQVYTPSALTENAMRDKGSPTEVDRADQHRKLWYSYNAGVTLLNLSVALHLPSSLKNK